MSSFYRGWIVAISLFVFFIFLHVTASFAKGRSAMTVVVTSVKTTAISKTVVATGNVVAWRELPIGSEVSGLRITELGADQGDTVKRGEVLARLSQSILNARVNQQEAAISELQATLNYAKADVRRALSVSKGVISTQTKQQRTTLVATTQAKLRAARALLDEVKAQLGQTEILAPADGLISSRSVSIGQVLQTGTELFRIIQDNRLEVDALIPEGNLSWISAQQDVLVTGPDGRVFEGNVRAVAPTVDPRTRLGTVHVILPENTNLRPGMFARVSITTNPETRLAVPLDALVWRNAEAGVFTVSGEGTASFKRIETGKMTNKVVEVRAGLRVGEQIVLRGAGLLNDGDKVRVVLATMTKPKDGSEFLP